MRKLLQLGALGALVLAAAAEARDRKSGGGHLYNRRPALSSPLDPFVFGETFNFATNVSSLPTCVGESHCVMLCLVHPGTGDWECIDNAGATVSGMTQGVGMSYSGAFASAPDGGFFQTMHFIDDTSSNNRLPKMDSAALRALLGTNTYTIGLGGYASTIVTAGPQWWAGITDGTRFVQIRAESGAMNCIESGGTYGAAGLALDGWSNVWCRRDDATHASGRLYGVGGQAAVPKQSALTSGSWNFGGGVNGCCSPGGSMGGDLAWVVFYDDARTDAQLDAYERGWFGVPNVQSGGNGTAGTVAGAVSGVTCRDAQDGGFYVDCFNAGGYIIDRDLGMWATRGWQNAWAADPLAAATWTDVATPTVTTNASAGPFSRWHARNECDLIVDNDGAAFEGKRSGELSTKTIPSATHTLDGGIGIWANATCYLAAGTSGVTTTKARIRLVHDGVVDAGSDTCDITGLTSTPARLPGSDGLSAGCYAWIHHASTIKADVLVGTSAAETGSITVCQCQLTNTLYPDIPTVHGNLGGANWPELDGGGFPFGPSKGAVDVVFKLPFSTSIYGALPVDLNKVIGPYLMDAYHTGDSHDVLLALTALTSNPSGTTKPGVQALMYGDSGTYENRFDIPSFDTQSAINFTQGQWYVLRYEWRTSATPGPTGSVPGCVGYLYIDTCSNPDTCTATTLIASNPRGDDLIASTSPGTCPQFTDTIDIGTRQQGTSPSTMYLRRITYSH